MNANIINPTVLFPKSGHLFNIHVLCVLKLADGSHLQVLGLPEVTRDETGKAQGTLLTQTFPVDSGESVDSNIRELDVIEVISGQDARELKKKLEAELATA